MSFFADNMILYIENPKDEARWWKSRGTCSPSPTNTTKKHIYVLKTPTEQQLNAGRRT